MNIIPFKKNSSDAVFYNNEQIMSPNKDYYEKFTFYPDIDYKFLITLKTYVEEYKVTRLYSIPYFNFVSYRIKNSINIDVEKSNYNYSKFLLDVLYSKIKNIKNIRIYKFNYQDCKLEECVDKSLENMLCELTFTSTIHITTNDDAYIIISFLGNGYSLDSIREYTNLELYKCIMNGSEKLLKTVHIDFLIKAIKHININYI